MTIFVVDLEAVSTRYTGEWKLHVPELLKSHGHDVVVIEGPSDIPDATTPGAFLNFGGTNIYKSVQVEKISRLFTEGKIESGDHFLFTDAWHPGIINLKYMSELLRIPVTIHALWHAGSYDPQDFLGRLIGNAAWVRHAEKSFFHAIDHNYFATDFHIKMFFNNLLQNNRVKENPWAEDDFNWMTSIGKIIRTGWPMEYMSKILEPYQNLPKRDTIVFPHRIAPEKQVEIFRDLATVLPQYEFIVCQDKTLTKHEYHTILGEAKIVFSANLQETLGISCYEGAVVGAIPLVPDRLSYSEMYFSEFKYPSLWTHDYKFYLSYRSELCDLITQLMTKYSTIRPLVESQAKTLESDYFSMKGLLNEL